MIPIPVTYTFDGVTIPAGGILTLKAVPSGDDFLLLPNRVDIQHISVAVDVADPYVTYEIEVLSMGVNEVTGPLLSRTLYAGKTTISTSLVALTVSAGSVLQVRVRRHLADGSLVGETQPRPSPLLLQESAFTQIEVGLDARLFGSVEKDPTWGWNDDPLSLEPEK